MMRKMIYKCTKCYVEYIDNFRLADSNEKCPKCGSFLKVRFWHPDKRIEDSLSGKEQA